MVRSSYWGLVVVELYSAEFEIEKDPENVKEGQISYRHFGEGAYQETELPVRNLPVEAHSDVFDVPLAVR